MKLRNKFILSCAALAACATTMVSTTYAWYISATDVSVSGVTGSTNNASADGSLLVAKKTGASSWSTYSNSVTIAADETNAYINRGNQIVPLALNSKGALIPQEDALAGTDTAESHVGTSGAFISIPLKFKTTKNTAGEVPIYLKALSITNNATGALTKVDGIATAGDVTQGTPYSVDACYAMNMMVCLDQNKYASATDHLFDLGGYVVANETANASVTGNNAAYNVGSGAHAYYNAAMPNDKHYVSVPADSRLVEGGSTATSLYTFTLNGAAEDVNERILYFVFYLDGWDNDCYDACRGQSFTINLGFTSDSDTGLSFTTKS